MLKLLTELFGSNYVKSLIGTKSNITKPIRMDFNSPYKVYSDDAFENPKALAIIEEKIREYAPYAMSNKNASEVANFELNLGRLKNAKMKESGTTPGMIKSVEEAKKPKPEADVLDIGTGKKVDDEGIMSLKDELGLPEGIDPKSQRGKLIQELQRSTAGSKKAESIAQKVFDDMMNMQSKTYSIEQEGRRRAVMRNILLMDDRVDLPADIRKRMARMDDLKGDEEVDPLKIFERFYLRNNKQLEVLDDVIETAPDAKKAAEEFLAKKEKFDLNPAMEKPMVTESLDDEAFSPREMEETKDLGDRLKDLDDDIDPDALAEGGRPGSGLNNILGV